MTPGEKQRLFAKLLGEFLVWIYTNGYEITLGEAFRTPEQAALNAQNGSGISNSLHTLRLAIDLNLFVNGNYQVVSIMYKPLGDKWKSMHELARWGGDFTRSDGNHFSLEHEGIQ